MKGIAKGAYCLPSPDSSADFLVKGCLVARSPRPHCLLMDMMLAPLYVFGIWQVSRILNRATERMLSEEEEARKRRGRIHVQMNVWPAVAAAVVSLLFFVALVQMAFMLQIGVRWWGPEQQAS